MSSSCPICFETFEGKIKASPDVCNHIFCMPCLQTWSKTDNICPIDRKKFRKIINLDSDSTIQIKPRKRRRKRVFYDITAFCEVCKGSSNGDTLLLCDSCDLGYHCKCLTPPLSVIPNNTWHCPECVAIDLRLRTKNATTAGSTSSRKYAKKRKKQSERTNTSKTKVVSMSRDDDSINQLRIRHNKQRHSRRKIAASSLRNIRNCIQMENSLKKKTRSLFRQCDDQPGPSGLTTVLKDTSFSSNDEFVIGNSDFSDSSSSDSSSDEISGAINYFHQQELSNAEMSSSEGSSQFREDEFQDYDFDGFSSPENDIENATTDNQKEATNDIDIKPFLPLSSEPCTSATSTCQGNQFEMESSDSFDFGDFNFESSSSESEVQDLKVSSKGKTPLFKYINTADGCYRLSPEKSKNETDSVRKPEKTLHTKYNNSTTNHFISLSPKKDFMKSLKEARDLNRTIDCGKNLYSENDHIRIDNVKESKENLHAEQNNLPKDYLTFSSSEHDFMESEKKASHVNRKKSFRNVSSCKKSHIKGVGGKRSAESLPEKPNDTFINNLNSSPKKDFMKNFKKAKLLEREIDNHNISCEKSHIELDSVTKSEESLLSKQDTSSTNYLNFSSSKSDLINDRYLKRKNGSCNISTCEKSRLEVNSTKEPAQNLSAKENYTTINNLNSSFPNKDVMKISRTARSKSSDVYEPDDVLNSCNSSNSTFESDASDVVDNIVNTSPSVILENEMDVVEKHTEQLFHEDIDSCNATSSESNETKVGCHSSNTSSSKDDDSVDIHSPSPVYTANDCNSSCVTSPLNRETTDVYISTKNLLLKKYNKTTDKCKASSSKNNEIKDYCHFSNSLSLTDNESVDNCSFLDSSLSKHTLADHNLSSTSSFNETEIIDENISTEENIQIKIGKVKSKEQLQAKVQNQTEDELASSSSDNNENYSIVKYKDRLQDNDENSINSLVDCHKAIMLKLPLRLTFKRMPKTPEKNITKDTLPSATVDNISASICTIASLQQLDSETFNSSDDNLLSNSASINTDNDLQLQNSTDKDEQSCINNYCNITPTCTSIPIIFSLIEEQNAFEPLPIGNTSCFYSNDSAESLSFMETVYPSIYSRQAKQCHEMQEKTLTENSPTKKLIKTDYSLNLEKSGNLTIPTNASHLFGKQIFIKDIKQLSVRNDGSLFLNWKQFNS